LWLLSLAKAGFAQTGPAGVGSLATNRFWLRVDRLTGFTNGDPVRTWTDQSGNSNNATGVNGPTYVLNGSGGLPAINFNGTNQYHTFSSLAALTQGEIFLVSKINNYPPPQLLKVVCGAWATAPTHISHGWIELSLMNLGLTLQKTILRLRLSIN